jgi:hypothetical protein
MRHSVSVSVPERWKDGALQIGGFIKHHTQAVGFPLHVSFIVEAANRHIRIADARDLTKEEYQAVDSAIQTLNEGLTRAQNDVPWRQGDASAVQGGLLSRLAKLEAAFKTVRKPKPQSP